MESVDVPSLPLRLLASIPFWIHPSFVAPSHAPVHGFLLFTATSVLYYSYTKQCTTLRLPQSSKSFVVYSTWATTTVCSLPPFSIQSPSPTCLFQSEEGHVFCLILNLHANDPSIIDTITLDYRGALSSVSYLHYDSSNLAYFMIHEQDGLYLIPLSIDVVVLFTKLILPSRLPQVSLPSTISPMKKMLVSIPILLTISFLLLPSLCADPFAVFMKNSTALNLIRLSLQLVASLKVKFFIWPSLFLWL